MTRSLVFAVAFLGLLGIAAGPATIDAARHEVSGKGRFSSGDYEFRFRFSARGGPSEATGSLRWVERVGGILYTVDEGTVTCLKVRRNRMVIAGEVTSGLHAGEFFLIRAQDTGRHKRRRPDEIAGSPVVGAPDACAGQDLSGDLDAHPLDRGNIEVR